ncbi:MULTISPECIES: hypothetical protein, partial [unclassified Frankia]|uniref:hypothetical protein n=1 Tax=unclassified Frankia TaxID=2632575 RepID=UPI001EF6D745
SPTSLSTLSRPTQAYQQTLAVGVSPAPGRAVSRSQPFTGVIHHGLLASRNFSVVTCVIVDHF